jgi:hypothetical protein
MNVADPDKAMEMIGSGLLRVACIIVASLGVSSCRSVRDTVLPPTPEVVAERAANDARDAAREAQREEEERVRRAAEMRERARDAVPAAPDFAQPTSTAATRIWRSGVRARGLRIMVATDARGLWLMRDTVVLFRAPIAVGTEEPFEWAGKRYDFTTPVGQRRVMAKDTAPLWVPPDWHYFEVAAEKKLKVVNVRKGQRYLLSDSTIIEMRGDDVGRINRYGNFWPFTPGSEIVFDDKVFVPPLGSKQRQVPKVLGTHKLVLGDGYLIHGTDREDSIGEAVSHGCVRMYNEDVQRLYELVPVGTAVYIF